MIYEKIKFSPIALIYVLANLFYFVYDKAGAFLFVHDFVVIYILFLTLEEFVFLFSINDFHPDPLSSSGELSSHFFLFPCHFTHDRGTPCFEQLPCINYKILFN